MATSDAASCTWGEGLRGGGARRNLMMRGKEVKEWEELESEREEREEV